MQVVLGEREKVSDRGGNAGVARVAIGSTLIGAALAIAGPSAFAQESGNGQQAIMLDELVVTGEKIDRTLRRTASSVTVITAEEAKNKPYAGTTSELLEFGVPISTSPARPRLRSSGASTRTAAHRRQRIPVPPDTQGDDQHRRPLSHRSRVRDRQRSDLGPQVPGGVPRTADDDPGRERHRRRDHRDDQRSDLHAEAGGQVLYGSFRRMRASAVVSGPVSDETRHPRRRRLQWSRYVHHVCQSEFHGSRQGFRF